MNELTDQHSLLEGQYKDPSKLDARVRLHTRFSTNPYGWYRWVFDQLRLSARARLLEIGSGHADLWQKNLDRIPAEWEILLSDFSPGMLEETRKSLSDCGRPFASQVVDAQSIPFHAGTFDAVIANHMLYHVPDREKALSEIHRVLKPEGCLYAATNGRGHMEELFALMRRSAPGEEGRLPSLSFTLDTGRSELSRRFEEVDLRLYEDGLEVAEVEPIVDYVRSMNRWSGDHIEACRRLVEQEIDRRGALHISKEVGLFVARRGISVVAPIVR